MLLRFDASSGVAVRDDVVERDDGITVSAGKWREGR